VNSQTGTVVLGKADVGLNNVDNTSDLNKPISTATQTALNAKADLVGGVIPSSQMPTLALTDVVTVADQTAMLALTTSQVQPGDIAVRTDGAGSFILTATDPSQLANWVLLRAPTDTVTSVNSQTGAVVLTKTDIGLSNVDNTSDATKNSAAVTLSNKTFDNSNVITAKDTNFTLQDDGDTTKQLRFQLSSITSGSTRVLAVPDASTTIIGADTFQTLTNKIYSPSNATTAMSGGTLTMSFTDASVQIFTGASATGHTVKLPTTFVKAGMSYTIINQNTSTGIVTVQSSGANNLNLLGAGAVAIYTARQDFPTSDLHWASKSLSGTRYNTTTSSATPSINTDTTDEFDITAQAVAITSMTTNLTGTPVNGQKLIIRIKDSGTSQTITWGTSFQSSGIASLLTNTVPNKTHYVGLAYNSTDAKWTCLAVDASGY
jgi:hypothetical protein